MVRWMLAASPCWGGASRCAAALLLVAFAAHCRAALDLDLLLAGVGGAASRGVAVARLRLALLLVDSLAVRRWCRWWARWASSG